MSYSYGVPLNSVQTFTAMVPISANVTLSGQSFGKEYLISGAGNYTINLPLLSAGRSSNKIFIINDSNSGTSIISAQGADVIRINGSSVASLNLLPGEATILQHAGTYWVLGDTAIIKVSTNSPIFTGTPTAPTAAANTNSTQLATTAFVLGQASGTTPNQVGVAQPGSATVFSRGDHVHPNTAVTAAVNDSSTTIATTAFVNAQISNSALLKTGGTMTGPIIGSTTSMSMSADAGATTGSFKYTATGTGDANVAGGAYLAGTYGIKMGLRADGIFGIGGWSRSNWSWYTDASSNMVSAGNVSAYSDPRLKENFKRVENPVELLKKLEGGTFNWKTGYAHIEVKAGKRDYGILADQVEAVMPEIVTESIEIEGQKFKTVAYDKLIPVLIEAVKELAGRIEELENGLPR